jgi:hypothetical protein
MAYRLEDSLSSQTFKLHGLDPSAKFRITSDNKDLGTMTGRTAMEDGISVDLDAPWRATVIELQTDDLP